MSHYIDRQSGAVAARPNKKNRKNGPLMSQDRRNDYDVTNSVQVSRPAAVRDAVHELYSQVYPGVPFDKLWLAFHDFERLFRGDYPGYFGCDTTYHDMQHTLDMTLALARLIAGYEKSAEPRERLGAERTQMAIVTSLFHDAGYIRHRERDKAFSNGAEFTMQHVSRSADFLRRYLPELGLADYAAISSMIVHFTGYELELDNIELDDPRDAICGHLLGTADLIAQMADRCYLEKCRDRLYKEFVLGGVAIEKRHARRICRTLRVRRRPVEKKHRCSTSRSPATGCKTSSTGPIATSRSCMTARNPYTDAIKKKHQPPGAGVKRKRLAPVTAQPAVFCQRHRNHWQDRRPRAITAGCRSPTTPNTREPQRPRPPRKNRLRPMF